MQLIYLKLVMFECGRFKLRDCVTVEQPLVKKPFFTEDPVHGLSISRRLENQEQFLEADQF